eukprot:TRINITY_DN2916_c0_g1_i2.p1 TRINITY_DN2916_c0_g1~~TRINITY_DN2916_c0_g1_i2.p1  ORF type:complete len:325 (+),score=27.89 TRINITY_DN2916_c0_g1_i2:27-1001(+)
MVSIVGKSMDVLDPDIVVLVLSWLSWNDLTQRASRVSWTWRRLIGRVLHYNAIFQTPSARVLQRWRRQCLLKQRLACCSRIDFRLRILDEIVNMNVNISLRLQATLACRKELMTLLEPPTLPNDAKQQNSKLYKQQLKAYKKQRKQMPLFTEANVMALFHLPTLQPLCDIQQKFVAKLQDLVKNFREIEQGQQLGRCYFDYLKEYMPCMLMHVAYLSTSQVSFLLFQSKMATDRATYKPFWDIMGRHMSYVATDSAHITYGLYLGVPGGTIARIGLMLSEVLRKLTPWHPDYTDAQSALALSGRLVNQINTMATGGELTGLMSD